MARGKCAFRKTTLKRAIETIEGCGKRISHFEIDEQGRIIILTGEATAESSTAMARAGE